VADFIGVSENTVRRRTQALIAAGWLIDTDEEKQWQVARTPVRIINVPKIVGSGAPPQIDAVSIPLQTAPHQIDAVNNPTKTGKVEAPHQIAPHQFEVQGSNGSLVIGLGVDLLCSGSGGSGSYFSTGVPPVKETPALKTKNEEQTLEPRTLKPENLEPENLEPTPEPKPQPTPMAKAGSKRCKDCGEPLLRGVNHLLACSPVGTKPTQMGETDGKNRESIVMERTTPFVVPRAADPPARLRQKCDACGRWEGNPRCCKCYSYEPPKPEQRGIDMGMPPQKPIPQPAWVDDVFD
jgi:hypothetical protein